MSETQREYAANYRQAPLHTRFKKCQSGNLRGRPAKNRAALLAAALNEMVTVTENGKRRQVTKREAVIALLVNESASAELRATKMLIDILRDIEKRAGSTVIPAKAAVREIGWISAVRSSRQPLRGFLGMRNSVNAINDFPHAEEPPLRDRDCGGSS
jgi:hypothetical protein